MDAIQKTASQIIAVVEAQLLSEHADNEAIEEVSPTRAWRLNVPRPPFTAQPAGTSRLRAVLWKHLPPYAHTAIPEPGFLPSRNFTHLHSSEPYSSEPLLLIVVLVTGTADCSTASRRAALLGLDLRWSTMAAGDRPAQACSSALASTPHVHHRSNTDQLLSPPRTSRNTTCLASCPVRLAAGRCATVTAVSTWLRSPPKVAGATLERYGREYMRELASRGGKASATRKARSPATPPTGMARPSDMFPIGQRAVAGAGHIIRFFLSEQGLQAWLRAMTH